MLQTTYEKWPSNATKSAQRTLSRESALTQMAPVMLLSLI
jgi:hypothetical protein